MWILIPRDPIMESSEHLLSIIMDLNATSNWLVGMGNLATEICEICTAYLTVCYDSVCLSVTDGQWLELASQWHEMHCHDLKVMSLNPGRVELGVLSTSVLSRTWTKNICLSVCLPLCVCVCVSLPLSQPLRDTPVWWNGQGTLAYLRIVRFT